MTSLEPDNLLNKMKLRNQPGNFSHRNSILKKRGINLINPTTSSLTSDLFNPQSKYLFSRPLYHDKQETSRYLSDEVSGTKGLSGSRGQDGSAIEGGDSDTEIKKSSNNKQMMSE